MWRAVVLFLALAAIGFAAAWIAERPGAVVLQWQGLRVDTTVGVLLAVLLLLLAVVLTIYRAWHWLHVAPTALHRRRVTSRQRRGYDALTRGMVAVAAGDVREARRLSDRAAGLLDEPPLTLLLAAQVAQLEGDEAGARRRFEELAARPETEFLGLRGLLVQARRAGDTEAALRLAERAHALRPETPWVVGELFALQAARGEWAAAQATLEQGARRRLIAEGEARRNRAVVAFGQALAAEARGEHRQALDLAREAHKHAPDFVPATALAGRMLGNLGKQRQARKLLEEGWAGEPHPEIAAAYAELQRDETAAERRVRLQRLAALRPEHEESHVVLAQAAMACADWDEARRQLDAIGGEPDARYCRLMADLTERSGGDSATVRYWLRRAAGARLYATWVCEECGRQSRTWAPHCPDCHAFDSFAWRSPAGAPPPLLTAMAPEPEDDAPLGAESKPAPA